MDLTSRVTSGSRAYKLYASRLEKLGILTFADFLFHLPSRYEDYTTISLIKDIQPGETVTIQGKIVEMKNNYLRGKRIKSMQKATIEDNTGTIYLTWFNQPFLAKALQPEATLSISGKAELTGRKLTMNTPRYEVLYNNTTNAIHTGRLIPVYPETQGVSSKWLRRQIYSLLPYANQLTEYLPEKLIKENNFPTIEQALQEVHFPNSFEQAEKARERLAFDELFLIQLAARKRKEAWKQQQKSTPLHIAKSQNKIEELIAGLPFTLTTSQRQAVDDILHDLGKDKAMNRLLQGDVGSGKTIVAAVAMYATYLSGYQSVLMAPTEILAEQHFTGISKLLEPLGVKVALVTGSKKLSVIPSEVDLPAIATRRRWQAGGSHTTKNPKKKISPRASLGRDDNEQPFDILIGTHAVLSEKVTFKKLAFVAIDEQQRFGVEQRGTIREKGDNPHLLTMTATPIPRTVMLTMYGNLDVSYLTEMPHGRKKIKTWLVPPSKRDGAYTWIREQLQTTDSQAFIICPFIEESENMQTVKAAAVEYERLQKDVYPDLKLGLLHGKLKGKEKDAVLEQFRNRAFTILVATPVVEVGIDIPNATIIMIEASERFGLAQLHQLRGRVGRGDKQSYCLLFAETSNPMTRERLKSMETIYSGAELAEMDLKLRGGGDIYGTSQHGMRKLKVASFGDTEMIQKAKHAADRLYHELEKYPELKRRLDEEVSHTIAQD